MRFITTSPYFLFSASLVNLLCFSEVCGASHKDDTPSGSISSSMTPNLGPCISSPAEVMATLSQPRGGAISPYHGSSRGSPSTSPFLAAVSGRSVSSSCSPTLGCEEINYVNGLAGRLTSSGVFPQGLPLLTLLNQIAMVHKPNKRSIWLVLEGAALLSENRNASLNEYTQRLTEHNIVIGEKIAVDALFGELQDGTLRFLSEKLRALLELKKEGSLSSSQTPRLMSSSSLLSASCSVRTDRSQIKIAVATKATDAINSLLDCLHSEEHKQAVVRKIRSNMLREGSCSDNDDQSEAPLDGPHSVDEVFNHQDTSEFFDNPQKNTSYTSRLQERKALIPNLTLPSSNSIQIGSNAPSLPIFNEVLSHASKNGGRQSPSSANEGRRTMPFSNDGGENDGACKGKSANSLEDNRIIANINKYIQSDYSGVFDNFMRDVVQSHKKLEASNLVSELVSLTLPKNVDDSFDALRVIFGAGGEVTSLKQTKETDLARLFDTGVAMSPQDTGGAMQRTGGAMSPQDTGGAMQCTGGAMSPQDTGGAMAIRLFEEVLAQKKGWESALRNLRSLAQQAIEGK